MLPISTYKMGPNYLQRVFTRKALVAVTAWERLHGQVNPLVALQIVIAIETLWALIALEWTVVRRCLVGSRMCLAVYVTHACRVSTVGEPRHHTTVLHPADQGKLAVRVVDIGKHRSRKRVALVLSLVRKGRMRRSRMQGRDRG